MNVESKACKAICCGGTAKEEICHHADVSAYECIAGCAVGMSLGTWGLPFLEAAFGVHGVRFALIWDMANIVAGAVFKAAASTVCRIS